MGDDADGLALSMHPGQLLHQLLGWRVVLDEVYGYFGEGPLEMGIADLGSSGSFLLAG